MKFESEQLRQWLAAEKQRRDQEEKERQRQYVAASMDEI